jgi:hypothetical protein
MNHSNSFVKILVLLVCLFLLLHRPLSAQVTAVPELITTEWDIRFPFNMFTPRTSAGYCQANCAAVALANILNYHQYPPVFNQGEDFSYHDQGQVPGIRKASEIDSTHEFFDLYPGLASYGDGDFTRIPDTASPAHPDEAVHAAHLIYHCGVAMQLNYHRTFIYMVNTPDIPQVLRTFFDYACDNLHYRLDYPPELWKYRFKQNLQSGRPVFLGYNTLPMMDIHCAVCDKMEEEPSDWKMDMVMGFRDLPRDWLAISELGNQNSEAIFNIQPNPENRVQSPPGSPHIIDIHYTPPVLNLQWQAAPGAEEYIVIKKPLDRACKRWTLVEASIRFTRRCSKQITLRSGPDNAPQVLLFRVIARNQGGWTFSEPVLLYPDQYFTLRYHLAQILLQPTEHF